MGEIIKVGLFGFGRTGRLIANEFLNDPRFSLEWVVRKSAAELHNYSSLLLGIQKNIGAIYQASEVGPEFFASHPVDVIVDFSHPDAVAEYASAADFGVKIISAISHYEESSIERLKGLSEKTAVLYSPNITLGVNVLIIASQILQKIAPHADVEVVEEHFRDKGGVSGTALKIAKALELDPVTKVNSIRVGGVVGRHEVIFGLPNQTIRLTHESLNRAAFGQGAIFAAKWLVGQQKGFFSMEQIVSEMFKHNIPVY
jgi:4-hydroxy-tetrahydrodipicolinate reductase